MRRRRVIRPPRREHDITPLMSFAEKVAADPHVRHLLALVAAGDPRVDLGASEEEYAEQCREWRRRGGAP